MIGWEPRSLSLKFHKDPSSIGRDLAAAWAEAEWTANLSVGYGVDRGESIEDDLLGLTKP